MNKLNLLAYPLVSLIALFSAGAALAERPTLDDSATQVWAQTKTRAQVHAELLQARADGTTKVWSSTYDHMAAVKSTKTREAVRAELFADRQTGAAAALVGEDSGSAYLAGLKTPQPASRLLATAK